jgi:tRNA(Phe) wybutosine-synthesizing methylase Tyw3
MWRSHDLEKQETGHDDDQQANTMTARATSRRNRPITNNHKQVWIKVNAHVDTGIVRLVEALSSFPQLRTTSSCQGNPPRGADVTFVYGEDVHDGWKALAEFVLGWFGPRLIERVGDDVDLSIRVTTLGSIRADLHVRPGALELTTKEITLLAREFKNSYVTP